MSLIFTFSRSRNHALFQRPPTCVFKTLIHGPGISKTAHFYFRNLDSRAGYFKDRPLLFSKLGLTGLDISNTVFNLKIFIWNLSAVKKRELIAYLVPNIFASCLVAAGILVQILVLINSRKFTLFMGNLVIRSLIIHLDSVPYDTIHVRSRLEHVRNGYRSSSERVRPVDSAESRGLAYLLVYGIDNEQK